MHSLQTTCKKSGLFYDFSVFFINRVHGNDEGRRNENKQVQCFISKISCMGILSTELGTSKLIGAK